MSGPAIDPPRPARRWWKRLLIDLGLIVAGLYVVVLVVIYALQDSMIFPGKVSQGRPEAEVRPRPASGSEIVRMTTRGGDRVVALFGAALKPDGSPSPSANTRPTLLYFYGNGQYLGSTIDEFATMRRMGVNVLIPDYVGYGMSGGAASERGCYATADAAFEYLMLRADIDSRKILVGGFSLGGAVAIDLASRRPVAGLIASCTFTRMAEMASGRYPFLPTSLLLRHRFLSLDKIRRVRCPILLADGRLDPIIPSRMVDALARAAAGPVTRISMEDAGHDDLLRVADAPARATIGRFLDAIR